MIVEIDNVTQLPTSKRRMPAANITLVERMPCWHGNFLVDEKKAEVECGLCHEKLNPMWVLAQVARDDRRLRNNWATLKAELKLMGERFRTKCEHCNQMTHIRSNVRRTDIFNLAEKIKNGDEPA